MSNYIFILGRTPDLSLAELRSVFAVRNIPFKLTQYANQIALVESIDTLPVEEINKVLGGTVKVGKVIESLPLSSISDLDKLFTADVLRNEFVNPQLSKVEFGVSIYVCGGKEEYGRMLFGQHQQITTAIKSNLEKNGVKAHFPQIRETVISSASVDKNKLIQKGAEILLILTQDELLVGKTIAVQEFEAFSKRDFGRPVRDMVSGVMPPKLARMMINISGISSKKTLLDPFCGSGTVLQEALHLGFKKVIGTDTSRKAIEDTRENIAWYGDQFDVSPESITIQNCDVRELSKILTQSSINAIVTEPYLGPTLRGYPKLSDVQKTQKELKSLFISAYQEFAKILEKSGTVVMIFPVFNVHRKMEHMDVLDDIEQLGFSQESLSGHPRKSVTVGNNRDFVLREIVKFVKQ